jgi:hypothetical protein
MKAQVIALGQVFKPIAFQNLQMPESEQQDQECPQYQDVEEANPALQFHLVFHGGNRARHITSPSVPSIFAG